MVIVDAVTSLDRRVSAFCATIAPVGCVYMFMSWVASSIVTTRGRVAASDSEVTKLIAPAAMAGGIV